MSALAGRLCAWSRTTGAAVRLGARSPRTRALLRKRVLSLVFLVSLVAAGVWAYSSVQVETSVAEADVGQVKLDQPVTFTVDAFPNETFTGSVVQVRKAAQVTQNVVTYTVVVAVENPGGRLLPGMTANVKLIVGEKTNVLKVPTAALDPGAPATAEP